MFTPVFKKTNNSSCHSNQVKNLHHQATDADNASKDDHNPGKDCQKVRLPLGTLRLHKAIFPQLEVDNWWEHEGKEHGGGGTREGEYRADIFHVGPHGGGRDVEEDGVEPEPVTLIIFGHRLVVVGFREEQVVKGEADGEISKGVGHDNNKDEEGDDDQDQGAGLVVCEDIARHIHPKLKVPEQAGHRILSEEQSEEMAAVVKKRAALQERS